MELFPYGVEVRISDIVWCASGRGQLHDPATAPARPAGELHAHPEAMGGVRVPVRHPHPDDGRRGDR